MGYPPPDSTREQAVTLVDVLPSAKILGEPESNTVACKVGWSGQSCLPGLDTALRLKRGKRNVKIASPLRCCFSFSGSMMKRMSFSETIFLFFLALIIFGPKKLPEIARQIGKYMNEFKRASNEFKSQIEQEIAHLEVEQKQTILPPSPPPEGATSRTLTPAPAAAISEPVASESPATLAVSDDEPLFATRNGSASTDSVPATEAAAHPEDVTSTTSRESHV
jgi:sec-independent protein translocase protein TatB